MQSAGLELMYHTNDLAVIGFSEVLRRLPFLLRAMGDTLERLRACRPDRIILIDYPGFNLKLAKNCHGLNIPITYFILPQLWAWKENRIKYFHRYIDQPLGIFPFEPDWFERRGVSITYVGHPFSEHAPPGLTKESFFRRHQIKAGKRVLVLLPGSRQQEVDRHLPVYINAAKKIQAIEPNTKTVIGKAPGVSIPPLDEGIAVETNDIRAAISHGSAAITTSGTASLECAVLDTPEVVCYRMSALSGALAKRLNKAPYISMVNLIAEGKTVPELIQKMVSEKNIVSEIVPLISSSAERRTMLEGFSLVRRALGLPGVYGRAADAIIKRTTHG